MTTLFELRVGVDSLLCNILKSTLLRLSSRLRRKWHKTQGNPYPILVPYTTQSSSSTYSTSSSHIWTCNSPELQISLVSLFFWTLGNSWAGPTQCVYLRKKLGAPLFPSCLVTGRANPTINPYWHIWWQQVIWSGILPDSPSTPHPLSSLPTLPLHAPLLPCSHATEMNLYILTLMTQQTN